MQTNSSPREPQEPVPLLVLVGCLVGHQENGVGLEPRSGEGGRSTGQGKFFRSTVGFFGKPVFGSISAIPIARV
jgi:hypothetical protein